MYMSCVAHTCSEASCVLTHVQRGTLLFSHTPPSRFNLEPNLWFTFTWTFTWWFVHLFLRRTHGNCHWWRTFSRPMLLPPPPATQSWFFSSHFLCVESWFVWCPSICLAVRRRRWSTTLPCEALESATTRVARCCRCRLQSAQRKETKGDEGRRREHRWRRSDQVKSNTTETVNLTSTKCKQCKPQNWSLWSIK